jgi:hypothetical protein
MGANKCPAVAAQGVLHSLPAVPVKGVLHNLLDRPKFFPWPERGLLVVKEAENGGKNTYLDYVGLLLCTRIALMMRAKKLRDSVGMVIIVRMERKGRRHHWSWFSWCMCVCVVWSDRWSVVGVYKQLCDVCGGDASSAGGRLSMVAVVVVALEREIDKRFMGE